jgi:hypothetical protein
MSSRPQGQRYNLRAKFKPSTTKKKRRRRRKKKQVPDQHGLHNETLSPKKKGWEGRGWNFS